MKRKKEIRLRGKTGRKICHRKKMAINPSQSIFSRRASFDNDKLANLIYEMTKL
jgi:hypothetical protein